MTTANRPLPVAARKAAFGTCTTPATGCGRERPARGEDESAALNAPNAPRRPTSNDVRETMKTPVPTLQSTAPPSLSSHAGNRDDLVRVARAEADARRSDPAAVGRLARWLDAGRRVMENTNV